MINRPTVAGMNTLPIAPSVDVGGAQARPVRTQTVAVQQQGQTQAAATVSALPRQINSPQVNNPQVNNPIVSSTPPKPTPVAAVKPPVSQTSAQTSPLALAPKTATPTAAVTTGAFAVQVASAKTEGEAKSTFKNMQGKYDALDGKAANFVKADGDTGAFYRVRVNAGTKEKATELCTQLKSEGGNCFVVKN
jgi:cell division septation protein DedD